MCTPALTEWGRVTSEKKTILVIHECINFLRVSERAKVKHICAFSVRFHERLTDITSRHKEPYISTCPKKNCFLSFCFRKAICHVTSCFASFALLWNQSEFSFTSCAIFWRGCGGFETNSKWNNEGKMSSCKRQRQAEQATNRKMNKVNNHS